jgi:hypothetical protein
VKRTRLISTMFLGLILMGGLSCSTDQGTAPSGTAAQPQFGLLDNGGLLGTGLLKGLMTCTPMPYDSSSVVIGPAGGSIDAGANVLVVPRGALNSNVRISMAAPRDSVNSVRFYPEGLHFNDGRPAVLTMSYANCSLLARLAPKKIVYTSENLRILNILLSLDNILRKTVSAPVEHFSRYAVAY